MKIKCHTAMRAVICLLVLCCLYSCGRDTSMEFETLNIDSKPCGSCPEVKISIPEVKGRSKVARTVNNALTEEIISLLTFEDSLEVGTLNEAILSFRKGYEHIQQLYPDETPGWKAEIFADISYEDEQWLSIRLDTYTFTGGAHGYGAVRFLNFDKQKGTEIMSWQLFRNRDGFERLAEARFREQEKIPENKPINSTGFMFEEDRFYLPENIGLGPEGVKLLYNQYEVASYADGPIELVLPYSEVHQFLNYPGKS